MNARFLIKAIATDEKNITHTAYLCNEGGRFWFEKALKTSPQWAGGKLPSWVRAEAITAAKKWALCNGLNTVTVERDFI